MTRKLKTISTGILFSFLMIIQYQNCSQYGGENPFDSGSLDQQLTIAPLEAVRPRLDSPVGVLDLTQYDLNVSVAGECHVGQSSRHYIEVKMQDSNNMDIPVREDSLCPKGGTNLPADCYVSKISRCEHGKYNILLPVSCAAYRGSSFGVYRLKGQLVTFSDSGAEVRDVKTSFDRFFNISWAPNACL